MRGSSFFAGTLLPVLFYANLVYSQTTPSDSSASALVSAGAAAAACADSLASEVTESYRGKTLILDTNVIMNDPFILTRFPGARIILPGVVVEELDRNKDNPKVNYEVRKFAREFHRMLKSRVGGDRRSPEVRLENGATVQVDFKNYKERLAETSLDPAVNDNQIIATALNYKREAGAGDESVFLITDDILATIKAESVGVETRELEMVTDPDRFSSLRDDGAEDGDGKGDQLQKVEISDNLMEAFKERGEIPWPAAEGLIPNQFVQFFSPSVPSSDATAARYIFARPKPIFRGAADGREDSFQLERGLVFKPETLHVYVNGDEIPNIAENKDETGGWYFDGGTKSIVFSGAVFVPAAGANIEVRAQIEEHRVERLKTFAELGLAPLQSRSLEQTMALNVLLDESIDVVILEGRAGTSKTFSAVLAAKKMLEGHRKKVLITRAPIYLGNHDLGALPGGIDEKLGEWNKSILDSLDAIDNARVRVGRDSGSGEDGNGSGKVNKAGGKYGSASRNRDGNALPNNFKIEPFHTIRGRTLARITHLLDEAQNMTKHEIKSVLTRIGEGSKVVVMGDVTQIDPPHLNPFNNGLAIAIDKLTRSPRMTPERQSYVAVVRLRKGVRSVVSEIVSDVFEDGVPAK